MARWVFEGRQDWNFQAIGNVRETDAIHQAFDPEFRGDRVLSLVVGIQTMLIKAHAGKAESPHRQHRPAERLQRRTQH